MAVEARPSALFEACKELEQRRWERYFVEPKRHLWIIFERAGLFGVAIPSSRRIPAEPDPAEGLAKLRSKISLRPSLPATLIKWANTPTHRRSDPVFALGYAFLDPSPTVPTVYVAGYDVHGTAYWLMRKHVVANHYMADPDWQAADAPPVWAPVVKGAYGRNIVSDGMNYNLLDRAIGELSRLLPCFTTQEVRPWLPWHQRGVALPARAPNRASADTPSRGEQA